MCENGNIRHHSKVGANDGEEKRTKGGGGDNYEWGSEEKKEKHRVPFCRSTDE